MARSLRLLIPALTAVVVLLIGAVHGQLHHYTLLPFLRQSSGKRLPWRPAVFGWLLALIVLLWATTYAAGVNERSLLFGDRLVRSAGAVGSAVVIIALVQLVLRTPLLPLFDLGLSVIVLVPGLAALASQVQRSVTLEGESERVLAVVDKDERERLTRDIAVRPEHHSLLVEAVATCELAPSEECPQPLEALVTQRKITLVVLNREAQGREDIVAQAARAHSKGVRIRTL